MNSIDGPISVLYLEDDDALAHVTQRAFNRLSYNVFHFCDIDTLLNALPNLKFDYVLLDLKIGTESALPLIKTIRKHADVPIVVLTGYGTIRTAVQAMKLGAIDFLSKPCHIEEVINAFQSNTILPDVDFETLEKPSLKATEWEAIQKALDENDGNVSAAARQLKMHRRTLQRKLSKRHLE